MKKLLSLATPFIHTYQYTSCTLAIIMNQPNVFPWLLNSFIQLCGWADYSIDFDDYWFLESPFLECQRYGKDIISCGWSDLISFIKEAIDQGYYIYTSANVKCISAYQHQLSSPHDLLIYGYEDEKELFCIADHFSNGLFSQQTTSYQELLAAVTFEDIACSDRQRFKNHFIFYNDILALRCKNDTTQIFDPSRVKQSIHNYLQGKPTTLWYSKPMKFWVPEKTENTLFGIQCYQILYNYLDYAKQNGSFHSGWEQTISVFCNHKKAMYERFNYMIENQYISQTHAKQKTHLHEIYESFLQIQNLLIKYTINKDQGLLDRIITKLQYNVKDEEKLYQEILYSIQ